MRERRTLHFDMRISPTDNRALTELAKQAEVSKSQYLVNYIRRKAKLLGVRYE